MRPFEVLQGRSEASRLGGVGRGLAAGVAGTAVMTVVQTLAGRLQASADNSGGGEQPPQAEPDDPWEAAPAPAKVAQRIAAGVFHRPIPADRIPAVTNIMHWAYGTGWGAVYGLLTATRDTSTVQRGAAFGLGVWAMSYVELVPMGLYDLPWTYPPQDIALEVSYHVAYGAATSMAYAALDR